MQMPDDSRAANLFGRAPDQVSWVVENLENGLEIMSAAMGATDWVGWEYDGEYVPMREYGGLQGSWASRVAVCGEGPQLEVVEPNLSAGPSIFTEYLRERGPGLHHVGYLVPSCDEAVEDLVSRGFKVMLRAGGHGLDGDGLSAFLYLGDSLCSYIEVIEPPARRHGPHFTWSSNS